ncbi:response regulator transcription factor [Bordetella avium]|uniref:Probable two-component response regulator n=1 Tax=Bordetella avium (strain 197N) TaxID=360910 RepID=Q2L2I4_BORA1|nr:response regulator transcription factor [Bordetella avium]CAJ47602.1 probable two-component response regulator [Bordetella avium 197N]
MTGPMKIASLEDDLDQARHIQQLLQQAHYECRSFQQSQDLLAAMRVESFDLILVDWQLPDMDGDEVVRHLRARYGIGLPIIFLTSRNQEEDLVEGLNAGADDYIVKPLRAAELLARVAALLRRTQATASLENPAFDLGPYHVDPARRVIELHGEAIPLAPKEYELALLFLRNIGRLLSRDLLAESVWNREIPPTSRTLDTHLSNIRQKLQLRPENGLRLTSSYALGYRLETVAGKETPN